MAKGRAALSQQNGGNEYREFYGVFTAEYVEVDGDNANKVAGLKKGCLRIRK